MITIRIPTTILKVLASCSSHDETRWSLCGVCVELKNGDRATLIATDGRRLLTVRHSTDHKGEDVTFIIPSQLIDSVIHGELADIDFDPRTKLITLSVSKKHADTVRHTVMAIDANYPAWRQVIPSPMPDTFPARRIALNVGFLKDGLDAIQALGKKGVSVVAKDDAEGDEYLHQPVCFLSGDAMYVLMPLRAI